MKKLQKLVLRETMPLSEMEMIQVRGGYTSNAEYSCGVRCDQSITGSSISVANCDRSTVGDICGFDSFDRDYAYRPVCICG